MAASSRCARSSATTLTSSSAASASALPVSHASAQEASRCSGRPRTVASANSVPSAVTRAGSRVAVRNSRASRPAVAAGSAPVPATTRPVAVSTQQRTPRSVATAGSRSVSRAPAAIAATRPRCRPSSATRSPARRAHSDWSTVAMMSANDTCTGTSNSGTPCRRQAATRSTGTEPVRASPAPSAATPARASAVTNTSESAGRRCHISPVSTRSPEAR